jgi:hypothetical protein
MSDEKELTRSEKYKDYRTEIKQTSNKGFKNEKDTVTHDFVSEPKKSVTHYKEPVKKENTVYNQYRKTKKIKIISYFVGVGLLIAALTALIIYLMVTYL